MSSSYPKYGFHESMRILNEKGWPVGFDGKEYTLTYLNTSWKMPTLWHPKEWNWAAEAAFMAWLKHVAAEKYNKTLNIYERVKFRWDKEAKKSHLDTVGYSGSFSDGIRSYTRSADGGQYLRVRGTGLEAALAACVVLAQHMGNSVE